MEKVVQANLAKYCNDLGIKKRTIARKIGMSEVALGRIFLLKRGMTLDEYVLICNAIDKPPEYFINMK